MDDALHDGSAPQAVATRKGAEYLPHLLRRLGEDPRHAAARFEDLRRRLILFFRSKRPPEAEELADEVLDRIARRLAEGVDIERVEHYMTGVARFVLRERATAAGREDRARADAAYLEHVHAVGFSAEPADETAIAALRRCLQSLADAERSLILRYYGAEGTTRVRIRQGLARLHGISLNALHNRALRLRKRLERCVAGENRP